MFFWDFIFLSNWSTMIQISNCVSEYRNTRIRRFNLKASLKGYFDDSRCCLFSELVIYKCFKPFKAFLICSFYVIMYFCCTFCCSSAILLRPTKNITVDLSEGFSFDTTILELNQLAFNHCSVFFVDIKYIWRNPAMIDNLKFEFYVFSECTDFFKNQHFLWIKNISLNFYRYKNFL